MNYQKVIEEWSETAKDFFKTRSDVFERVISLCVKALGSGGKILIFGNGGSASQAQHFAAELVNKFLKQRAALRAIALTTDTSALTSIANDSSFRSVFARQVEALGDSGDIAIGLSTSGNSANVIEGLKIAREKKLATIAFTGKGGGKVCSFADYLLDVPSKSTPRIQEVHLLLLHFLAEEIERRLA